MEVLVGLIWIVSIIIGISVGSKKGEGCVSFAMCFLLGPLWLPVVFISNGNRKSCPFCRELIHKDAIICPHCRNSAIIIPNKEIITSKKCDKCETENPYNAKFCENCGEKFSQ